MKKFDKKKELGKFNLKLNKEKYIKYGTIGISCLILVVGIIMFAFAYFETKSPNYTLIHGEVEGSADVNILAIYKGDEKVDEIPAKNTGWEFDHADCTNNATATWDNTDWLLKLSLNTKTKCTLYFEEVKPTLVEYINGLDRTANSLMTDGTTDDNLRYVGANPNNYVQFNGELWEIIGVMNNIKNENNQSQNLVKIIRADSLGKYSWDTSSSSVNSGRGVNQWGESGSYEGADLMRELNFDYLGDVRVGTDGYWYDGGNNSKSTSKPSSTISSSAQNMIEKVVWNLGSPSNNNGTIDEYWDTNLTASMAYTRERANTHGKLCTSGDNCNDTVTRTSKWTGKVALIYLSDYLYATSGGNSLDRQSCLNNIEDNWYTVKDCPNNDWLWKRKDTITPLTPLAWVDGRFFDNKAYIIIRIQGPISNIGTSINYDNIFPVVHLKPSVVVTGGTGTSTDPYTLG